MDMMAIGEETKKMLAYLDTTGLKADEKIAVLRTTASLIDNVIAGEMLTMSMAKMLSGK